MRGPSSTVDPRYIYISSAVEARLGGLAPAHPIIYQRIRAKRPGLGTMLPRIQAFHVYNYKVEPYIRITCILRQYCMTSSSIDCYQFYTSFTVDKSHIQYHYTTRDICDGRSAGMPHPSLLYLSSHARFSRSHVV